MLPPSIIAIDGPAASGKGTVAIRVAQALGFSYLDSGALYRLLAYIAVQKLLDPHDEPSMIAQAEQMQVRFEGNEVYWENQRVSDAIRGEEIGKIASIVAAYPAVRQALLQWQRGCINAHGLVADGRDMGSAVFPEAVLKIFLTANVQIRAERRFKQLKEKGNNAILADILQDLQARDTKDQTRSASPLCQQPDALLLDTSAMGIDDAVQFVLGAYQTAVQNAKNAY